MWRVLGEWLRQWYEHRLWPYPRWGVEGLLGSRQYGVWVPQSLPEHEERVAFLFVVVLKHKTGFKRVLALEGAAGLKIVTKRKSRVVTKL